MNVLDLFSGIGGFSLGFERAGMRTVAFCETDTHCVSILKKRWPHVPVFGDVALLRATRGFADLVCGGFPCQPFSTAARGRNTATDLWPEFIRIVREIEPAWVVAENVPGIGHAGIERVSSDLEESGYEVWPFDLDSSLPQRQRGRHRIIWLAHAHGEGESRRAKHAEVASVQALSAVSYANDPAPLGMDDGLPCRMDRLHGLGNSITPYIAEIIGVSIMKVTS